MPHSSFENWAHDVSELLSHAFGVHAPVIGEEWFDMWKEDYTPIEVVQLFTEGVTHA